LVNDVTTLTESSDTGLSKALYKPLSVRTIKPIEPELNIKTVNAESTTKQHLTSETLHAFAAANHIVRQVKLLRSQNTSVDSLKVKH